MDLVHIGEQAKLENASLRTKHLYAPNPFGVYMTPNDYPTFCNKQLYKGMIKRKISI